MRRALVLGAVAVVVLAIAGGAGVWWLAGNDLPLTGGAPRHSPTGAAAPRSTANAPSPSATGSSGALPAERPGPVLLVPGYGGDTALLQPLAARLRADGRDASIVTLPDDATGDIRVQARTLDAAVRAAVAGGAPSVDIIGFSAGGVVARVWAADLGGAQLARRVVTLGSPHHGTAVAGLAAALIPGECPPACRELVPGSELLDGLGAVPAGPVWTSIWTSQDDLVTPAASSVLEGALSIRLQDICPDDASRHAELPSDPLVQALVRAAIGPAPPTVAPPASACTALRAG